MVKAEEIPPLSFF